MVCGIGYRRITPRCYQLHSLQRAPGCEEVYRHLQPDFGYKAHVGIDADSELITRVETTSGNVPDGDVFGKVVEDKAQIVTADKGYDSKQNHRLLKRKKKKSAIIIKKNRKSKRLHKNQMKAEVVAAQ